MKLNTLKKAILGSIVATLLIGHTSFVNANTKKATLPNDIFQGYWASTEPVQGMHYVINFEKDKKGNLISKRYIFSCGNTENFQSAKPFIDTITVTKKGLLLKTEGKYDSAIISVKALQTKQRLLLNHKLLDSSMNQIFPKGFDYEYAYTPIVKPICK